MRYLKFILIVGLMIINGFAFGQGCWSKVAAGHNKWALKSDSSLWGWGGKTSAISQWPYSQYSSIPIGFEPGSKWKSIDAGINTACFIKSDGTLWSWGIQLNGIIQNTTYIPTQLGLDTDWEKVICGGTHYYLAIKKNGTLWAWGWNWYHQLGDGTNNDQYNPIQIGIDSNWKEIAAGFNHSLAIKENGELWAWGRNLEGQCGHGLLAPNGSNATSISQIHILPGSLWKTIVADGNFSAGIKTDGSLWTWGANDSGQLGDGTLINKNLPAQVGFDTNWTAICAGAYHMLAIKTDGSLWTWGKNTDGELGNNTNVNSNVPIQIGTDTNWIEVSAGDGISIARKNDGSVYSWGRNQFGQIGDGTTVSKNYPVLIYSAYASPNVSSSLPICPNELAMITVNPNPSASFEWYDAATGGNLLATNDTFTTPTISATKNYWVQAVGGCGSTSARTQVTQIVNPKPEVTTTASNTKVCKNSHVVLNGAGANTYTWSNGAYNNIPFPVSSTTIYTVTGTDANNCTNTSTIEIEVKDLPAITINASQDTICNGDITMLSGNGGSAYTWSGGIFDQTPFIPTTTTTYTVTGTGAYSCTNTATKTVVVKNCNLNLKIFLQGYYTSNGMMQNVLFNEGIEPYPSFNVDTVTVELHKYFSPYALVETQKGILRMDGKLMVNFNADSTGEYYIVLKHRNHLQSWSSASANFLQANAVVNFTFSNGKTYGQNVAEVEPGIFAFYSGDINQDGFVTGDDGIFIDIGIDDFSSGYDNADLNGDGFVTGDDLIIFDINNGNFIGVLKPF